MSEYIKSLTAEDDSTYLIKENPAIHYGTCSTAAATVAKTVDIDGFKLDTGSWIAIKFTVTNTGAAGSLTLNVNNTGAYSIKYRNGNLDDKGYLAANRIYLFLFDGTYWQIVGDIDAGHPVIVKSTDTTSTASPAYGGTFTAVDSVTRDDFGHVTKINTKTVTLPADSNTDTKVTQTNTTTSADYRVLLSGNANDTTETTTGRKSANLTFNPSSGGLYSFGFLWTDITGQTLDINTLTLSNGTLHSRRFIEKTDGGAANITNIPVTGKPFLLEVDLIRWGSTTDYITRQRFTNAANGTYSYVRYCTNGTWGNWTTRKYTDTDTKVTSSANHYTPATASGQNKTASASGATAAWSIDVVKGVTLNTDGKGHVTGISVTSGKIPANPNTDRYVNSAAFTDDSANKAASPVKMTLTRAGSDSATIVGNIPKVSSSSAGVAPKGAAVSTQSQSTKFLREDGSWAAPSYTSIPSNNVTGSGTSGYLTKWNGTNTITNGPQLGSSTTTFLRNDGTWATPTNTNTTYTLGTSGNNVTLTPSSGSVQSITVPYASNAAQAIKLRSSAARTDSTVDTADTTPYQKYWVKIASCYATGNWTDLESLWAVNDVYGNRHGILKVRARVEGTAGTFGNTRTIRWIVADSDIDVNRFAIVCYNNRKPDGTTASGTATVELWWKSTSQYASFSFVLLDETRRTGKQPNDWVLYDTSTYGQAALPTTGNITYSVAATILNSTTGTSANVTGTVAIAHGGTGATTRLNALKALTNENVGTSAQYFLTITNSWGKGGYTSVADAKTVLGLGSAAYTESSDYVPNTQAGVSDAINLLSTGSTTPALTDYYVAQYANGGTTTTSYHRRPISALWNAFKGLITLATTGSGNAVTSVSIANDGDYNRKITVTKGSTFSLSNHTHTTTIAADSGTNQLTLAASTKYKLTTGGTNFIFTTPPNTTYSAGTGLSLSGTTFNHSNSVTAETTFDKSRFKYDAQGHITESGYYVHTASGTNKTSGWIKIATMKHIMTYDNTPIMLTISQRGDYLTYRLHIQFINNSTTDPPLGKFIISTDESETEIDRNPRAYMIKTAAGKWDLYIQKKDNYEALAVTEFDVGSYFNDHMTWTWQDVQTADSEITGGTEAERILPFNAYQSRTANTVLAAPNGSNGAATFRKLVAADLSNINYAGSSSAGGAATSANKLNTNAGSTNRPVYFSNGVPVACNVPASGTWFNGGIPEVRSDGVMEIGKIIDFHSTNTSTADYDLRLQYTGTATGKTVTLPGASGNVALLAKGGTSFYGMLDGDGTTSGWIRTTASGFLPATSVSLANGGDGALGTSSWAFKNAYIANINGVAVGSSPKFTDTKNTAGSTDTSSKIFLIGATSQATNPQTYSDNEVYVTNGSMYAKNYNATYDYYAGNNYNIKLPASGTWERGIVYTNSNSYDVGFIGAYGTGGSLDRFDISNNVENTTTNPWIRIQQGTLRIYASSSINAHFVLEDPHDQGARLSYNSSVSNEPFMRLFPGVAGTDTTGSGMWIGDDTGGITVVGAGHSAKNLRDTVLTGSTNPWGGSSSTAWHHYDRRLVLSSDTSVYLVSGASGLTTSAHKDWTDVKTAMFDSSGNFRPSSNKKGSIGTSVNMWNTIYGATIYENGTALSSKYAPKSGTPSYTSITSITTVTVMKKYTCTANTNTYKTFMVKFTYDASSVVQWFTVTGTASSYYPIFSSSGTVETVLTIQCPLATSATITFTFSSTAHSPEVTKVIGFNFG